MSNATKNHSASQHNNGKCANNRQGGTGPSTDGQSTEKNGHTPRTGRMGRMGHVPQGGCQVIRETARFLGSYIVLPEPSLLVIATWVGAAYLMDVWDRFPHLAIGSPEKRCGKTTLLDLLYLIVPDPLYTVNISPAALYRVIEQRKPTLLMDESQSISRRGSEASEVIREILNAGIGKNSKAIRCAGERMDEIKEFSIYSPKVFAMIGEPDAVLADRCLSVQLQRKQREQVKRYRCREVESDGKTLHDKLEKWAGENREKVKEAYDTLEPFDIDNDRMADLLTPLQAILTVTGDKEGIRTIQEYANSLDERDRQEESQSTGIDLLLACKDIFLNGVFPGYDSGGRWVNRHGPWHWLSTNSIINKLAERQGEPWAKYGKAREPITSKALAALLRPFGVASAHCKDKTKRGYFQRPFLLACERYIPQEPPSADTSDPSHPSENEGRKS